MKKLLLTYDVEEFDWRLGGGRPLSPARQIGITAEGLRKLLPIHERHRVPATFFVTGAFASAEPELVAETAQGRGVVGVIDGVASKGIESEEDIAGRRELLRTIGYKF